MSLDKYLTNHPDPKEWVVARYRHDRRRVSIRHSDGTPVSSWIAKLRNSFSSLQARRPTDLLEEVRRTKLIDLGQMTGREARMIANTLEPLGFDVQVEDASYVSHFPRVAGMGLIIEDDAEAEAFCLELIEAGATVQEVED